MKKGKSSYMNIIKKHNKIADNRFRHGGWSFPNKRTLSNNLCLPACKNY